MAVATLGIRVDSKQVKRGERSLDKLSGASKRAEAASRGMGTTATRAGRRISVANDNAARSARAMGTTATRAGRRISVANDKAALSARAMGSAFQFAKQQMLAFGVAAAAAFSIVGMFKFKDALAEVSTLVDTTTFDMKGLEAAAIKQSVAFGSDATSQTKAFYQIISAGASTAAEATDILTAANKLAVGGVTDITTAADGLTSVLNAYGDKVDGATAVSDSLFIAMRAGKTTIGLLSASLGKVAPLAAQAGVSFDELTASISALTKGGISTNEAVTGVRAILAAVVKPTSEAAQIAKRLGIDFSAAGLEAKGFAGFLRDLNEKAEGNTKVLAKLFGGVEALVPIMALSGQAGIDFYNILDQMKNKAGATQAAFDKMAKSPGFQARRVWSALKAGVLGVSGAMSGSLVVSMKFVADYMDIVAKSAKVAGVVLIAAFSKTLIANVVLLSKAVAGGLVRAFWALNIAMAANPLGALVLAITAVIAAAYFFRDEINRIFGIDIVKEAREGGNKIAAVFVGTFAAIKAEAYFFRDEINRIFGIDIVKEAREGGNKIAAVFVGTFAAIKAAWKKFLAVFNTGLTLMDKALKKISAGWLKLKFGPNPADTEAFKVAAAAYTEAYNAYINATANKGDKKNVPGTPVVPGTGPASEGGGLSGGLSEGYEKLIQDSQRFIETQEMELTALGLTTEAAAALRFEQQLLHQAANDNLDLSPAQLEALHGYAQGMAASQEATNAVRNSLAALETPLTRYEQKLKEIKKAQDANGISAKQAAQLQMQAGMQVAGSYLDVASQIVGTLGGVFKDNKAFAIGSAVINTAQGVTKALADYAPPFSFAMAAAQAAAGAAQIAAISSAQPGSSSSPRSSSGGGGGASSFRAPRQAARRDDSERRQGEQVQQPAPGQGGGSGGGISVPVTVNIDARGADRDGIMLAVQQLKSEVPIIAVAAIRDAKSRRVL